MQRLLGIGMKKKLRKQVVFIDEENKEIAHGDDEQTPPSFPNQGSSSSSPSSSSSSNSPPKEYIRLSDVYERCNFCIVNQKVLKRQLKRIVEKK